MRCILARVEEVDNPERKQDAQGLIRACPYDRFDLPDTLLLQVHPDVERVQVDERARVELCEHGDDDVEHV